MTGVFRSNWFSRRQPVKTLLHIGMVATLAGFSTGILAVEGDSAPSGLQGVYDGVPAALSVDSLAELKGPWEKFSQDLSADLDAFYSSDATATARQDAMQSLMKRRAALSAAAKRETNGKTRRVLLGVLSPLSRRLDMAQAALATLTNDPNASREQRIAATGREVIAAERRLYQYLVTLKDGEVWLKYIQSHPLVEALAKDPAAPESLDAAKVTAAKLAGRDSLTDAEKNAKTFLSRKAFVDFDNVLQKYIAVAGAPQGDAAISQLRTAVTTLLQSLEAYETTGTADSAAAARQAFRDVQNLSSDRAPKLAAAMKKYYFNYNMRINASEAFLSKMLASSRVEQGQVVDNILGANVGGVQTTSSTVGVNLRPSARQVAFDITLNGMVQSNTAGATDQATVYTQGYHTFYSTKQVTYDGKVFRTSPALISVRASNTTTGINVNYGGLFKGIANRIASQRVEEKRGAAESIAASRVQDRVLPRFNSEVDSSFNKASSRINSELYAGLRETNLYPQVLDLSSTDSTLFVRSRLMDRNELGATTPHPSLTSGQGARVLIHETTMNHAVDQVGLAGKTLTDEQVRDMLQDFLSKALHRKVVFKAAPKPTPEDGDEAPAASKFVFADTDPVRFEIGTDELTLILRTGFQPTDGDAIPTQEIRVPLAFKITPNSVVVSRGNIVVAGDVGIATRGVIRKKIQSSLPERSMTRRVKIKGSNREVVTYIRAIDMVDGWLSIRLN